MTVLTIGELLTMTAFANITLNTKVYGPNDIQAGIARWMERSAGSPVGFSPLTLSVGQNGNGSPSQKVVVKLRLPTVTTEESACGCPGELKRESFVNIEVAISKTSTQAERDDLLLRIQDLVSTTVFENAVKNLEFVSG